MYDFFKIECTIENAEDLLNVYNFKSEVSRMTGEIAPFSVYEYGDFKIKLSERGFVIVLGSGHKHYNNGQNYNDFTIADFINVVEEISGVLNCNLWNFKPDTIEIGVNIEPIISTRKLLRYSILHGHKEFKNKVVKNGGDFKQVDYQQYTVKLYDKGKQYMLAYDLMRFEINMKPGLLRRIGISCLSDLLKPDMIEKLGEMLQKQYNEILFIDPSIDYAKMPTKYSEKFKDWGNHNYWIELYENPPSKNFPNRELSRCKKKVEEYSQNIHKHTLDSIVEKWGELSDYTEHLEMSKLGTFTIPIIEIIFPNNRICKVTSLDISMQRKNSCFLAREGIRYYYENSPEIYDRLKTRLSSKWYDKPIEKQFYEIAHSVRNEYFNKIHNTRKRILGLVENPVLFSLSEMVENKYIIQARI